MRRFMLMATKKTPFLFQLVPGRSLLRGLRFLVHPKIGTPFAPFTSAPEENRGELAWGGHPGLALVYLPGRGILSVRPEI